MRLLGQILWVLLAGLLSLDSFLASGSLWVSAMWLIAISPLINRQFSASSGPDQHDMNKERS